MMMVMAFVAVASVMGMSILSMTSLQSMAASGQAQSLQADALADSGINLGLYYLQNISDPSKCPLALTLGGTSYSASRLSLGAAVPGTFDLAITRTGQSTYRISSTGNATSATRGTTVKKRILATVNVNYYGYGMSLASSSGATVTIPSNLSIDGNVYVNAPVVNNGSVSGTLYATSVTGTGSAGTVSLNSMASGYTPVPQVSSVNHYSTYTYNGRNYQATILGTSYLRDVTLGPTAGNPAGVYISTTALQLDENVNINGTLVVTAGLLHVKRGTTTVTPAADFPGLVVDGTLSFQRDGARLIVNGLTWIGGRIDVNGHAETQLSVTGTLLMPLAAGAIDSQANVAVTYDRSRASISNLASSMFMPPPSSVTLMDWKD